MPRPRPRPNVVTLLNADQRPLSPVRIGGLPVSRASRAGGGQNADFRQALSVMGRIPADGGRLMVGD